MPGDTRKPARARKKSGVGASVRLNPDFPVKPWIVGNLRFETVTLQQDDGTFVSVISTDQSVRKTARTRSAAEKGVIELFVKRAGPRPDDREDEDDLRTIREREKGPWIPGEEFLRRHGRG